MEGGGYKEEDKGRLSERGGVCLFGLLMRRNGNQNDTRTDGPLTPESVRSVLVDDEERGGRQVVGGSPGRLDQEEHDEDHDQHCDHAV